MRVREGGFVYQLAVGEIRERESVADHKLSEYTVAFKKKNLTII